MITSPDQKVISQKMQEVDVERDHLNRVKIQKRLNEHLAKLLPLATMFAGVFYTAVFLLQVTAGTSSEFGFLLPFNATSALVLLVFSACLYLRPVEARLAHPVLAGVFLLLLLNTAARLFVNPEASLGIIFYMLAIAVLINALFWFLLLELTGFLLVALIAWILFSPSDLAFYLSYNLVGLVVSILVFSLRFRVARRVEASLLETEARSRELVRLNDELNDAIKEKDRISGTLKESETRYRQLLDLAPVSIYVHRKGKILWVNPHAVLMLGLNSEHDLIGHSLMEFLSLDEIASVAEILKKREAAKDTSVSEILTLRHADGHGIRIEMNAAPIVFQGMEARMVIATNVTAQYEYQQTLKRARDAAEAANKEKSLFLSSMSHELRTPLNAVIGFCDLLLLDPGDTITRETRMRYLGLIKQSGEHLLSLISDLLEIGAVDSGALQLNCQPVSASELVAESISLIQPAAGKKQLKIDAEVADLTILGDRMRCHQILLNLLNNAVKFTAGGGFISVSAKVLNQNYSEFSVIDSGPGISPDEADKIFSEFYRSSKSESTEKSTGIGLAVCKRLVEYHQGEIGVRQARGGGSDFWFTLPLYNESSSKDLEVVASAGLEDDPVLHYTGEVLVVEDNQINLLLIGELLRRLGLKFIEAKNGKEGIRMAKEREPGVILMDIEMPVMNGLDATRCLRQLPEFSETPIIALTAYADRESVRLCHDAGCIDFISKPVDIFRLSQVLQKHIVVQG